MSLEDIVSVTITTQTTQVAKAGFGIPIIVGYHTNWVERVRSYSASTALTTLVDEGFATTSPIYLAMSAMLSQSPRPKTVMVGRRDDAWTQILRLTPTTPTALEVYKIDVDGTVVTFTADGTPTLAEACTGIAALITALPGVTASGVSGTYVDVTADVTATLHTIAYVDGYAKNYSLLDFTAEADIADDLNLIRAASPDWYGFVIDSNATSEIMDAAAWAETQVVLFVPTISDTDALTSSTTDVLSDLETFGYARTIPIFSRTQDSFAGAAWLAGMLTFQPGEATWAYKTLRGVPVDTLSDTEVTNIRAKHGNYYITIGGVAVTLEGWSSAAEYADITLFVDWLHARIQERIFALLVNRPKLGYTDESVDLVRSEISAQLLQGVANGGLKSDPAPTVEAPLVADVSPTDRAARLLPDIKFSAQLAGAIHTLEIRGNLSI